MENKMTQIDDNTKALSPQVLTGIIVFIAVFAIGAIAGMGLLMYRMVVSVENMSHDVHEMANLMKSINLNIDEMDHNILKMNGNIHSIQTVISRDIRNMSLNMQSMNSSILIIRDDIHYSAGSFSSPPQYFQNMFSSPR
jgi:hypothetical protein